MSKHKFISFKLLVSYLAMLGVIGMAFVFLQKEFKNILNSNSKTQEQNVKILELNQLITSIYDTDQKGRLAVQTNTTEDFLEFENFSDSIKKLIDYNKKNVLPSQIIILDSLKLMIDNKKDNLSELIELKFQAKSEPVEYKILKNLSNIESQLGKLTLDDFIKNPYELNTKQRKVAQDFVDYLNENIPNESKNINSATIDSLIVQSKIEIEKSKNIQLQRSEKLKENEIQLLRNDLDFSKKIAEIMMVFEQSIHADLNEKQTEIQEIEKSIYSIVKSSVLFISVIVLFFFIIILVDLFKIQKIRKKLEYEKSQKEKLLLAREQMIATISHDIRNPLTQIILHIDTLLQDKISSFQTQYLNRINTATLYINDLLNDLLEFAKIQSGKIKFQKTEVCVNELIDEIVEIYSQSKKDDVEIIVNTKSIEGLYFKIDALRYKQVLINLMSNALKFTEKGNISIQAYFKNNSLITQVVDTGMGIKPASVEFVFDEFTQVHENLEKGGSGLGLSICKKIVESLGGEITVESKLDRGSIFTFSMPTQMVDASKNASFELNKASFEKKTILLVDDDEFILKSTADVLKKTNAQIFTAENGVQALEILNQNPSIDLVITDIQMPKMNGYELLSFLKSSQKFKHIKIISLSGANKISELNSSKYQFDDAINKPFLPSDLIQSMNKIFFGKILKENKIQQETKNEQGKRYSLEKVKSFVGDDVEEIKIYLESFVSNMEINRLQIKENLLQKDVEQLKFIIHKMNSNWKMIDALELTEKLDVLERNQKMETEIFLKQVEESLDLMEDLLALIKKDYSFN